MYKLPIELIHKITNFLDPFDKINLLYVFKLQYKLEKEKNATALNIQIKNFSQNNYEFVEIIYNIIQKVQFIDYKIISILRDVLYLTNKISQSFKFLELSKNTIYIRSGSPYIIKYGNPILYRDSHIINIYYPKILILQKYISTFLHYKLKTKDKNLITMTKKLLL